MIPSFSSLWVGKELGPLQAACLRSFVSSGLPVLLYVYEPPRNLPENITLMDASDIVPESRIFRHQQTGSLAVFSDVFRYELLACRDTVWVDTDVYYLKAFSPSPYILGWEDSMYINNAILRLPAASPLLMNLLKFVRSRFTFPQWLSKREVMRSYSALISKGGPLVRQMPWGTSGPRALTHYVRKLGLTGLVEKREVFYPVTWRDVGILLKPGICLDDIVSQSTCCIHLYDAALKKLEFMSASPRSLIMRLLANDV